MERIEIGRVLRSWGREGLVVVDPWTHDATRFHKLQAVGVSQGERVEIRKVLAVRIDRAGRPVLRLEGVESIGAAECLRDARLSVPEDEACRPEGDSYFLHELIGARVQTLEGRVLGTVRSVLDTAGSSVLEVAGLPGGAEEYLIPFVRDVVKSVAVGERLVTVDPPAGLLELNDKVGDDHAL